MLKEMIRKNKNIVILYDRILNRILRVLERFSLEYASKFYYWIRTKKKINLKNPQTFDEKLMWLKLNTYYNNKLVTECVDKYKAREYVKQRGLEHTLNELFYVWDNPDDINWKKLPESFAIKCNHGCGYNLICDDKKEIDSVLETSKIKEWMKEDYWKIAVETNYRFIEKKIVCEKYLDTEDGYVPDDYKIHCFNGKPMYILYITDREKGAKMYLFDLEWRQMFNYMEQEKVDIKKPRCLEQMIQYAEVLADDFPFVRVDFYEYKGEPCFGELTFTPAACVVDYFNEQAQKDWGNLICL